MAEALDDIGAGKHTVMKRRQTFLWRERMETIASKLTAMNREWFHFGSQSEGTTTPGLQSDIDVLLSSNDDNIMAVWGDWEAGMGNFLMLHDDFNPPQQYLLKVISKYTPEPETRLLQDWYLFVRKDSENVVFSSERWKQTIEHNTSKIGKLIKNGPSVSWVLNWDIVQGFHVRHYLPEIQHWIERCRGRHWPPAQLLEAAQVAPCFLVPAGHPDSDYKREEWRLSPNLIERMLMFSFNMTQIKCYIVLKLIKQSLFAKIVGDSITSFHCKTIMFYTIERTHPSLWLEHNLMFLICLCLHLLKKWLRLGRLPHYIIEGTNLFDGKLSKVKQNRLLSYIDSMIKHNLQDIFHIDIDNLGCRLQSCSIRQFGEAGERELGGIRLRYSLNLLLKIESLERFLFRLQSVPYEKHSSNTTSEQYITYKLLTLFEYFTNVKLKTVSLEFLKHLYAVHSSMQSSKCLRLRNPVFSDIIMRFKYSLNTDVASSRLKLASVLYSCGHLHAALTVLEDLKRRYHARIRAVCGNLRQKEDRDLQDFANMISDNCDIVFSEPPFVFCVKFIRQELFCAPYILWFEMNRHMAEHEPAPIYGIERWMDCAEVDARPFLHYLQYLTYGGLGERDNQLNAMGELESYIYNPNNDINMYHDETALNLLGHCYEIEGDYEGALHYYNESLRVFDESNAAYWHVQRVQRLISR